MLLQAQCSQDEIGPRSFDFSGDGLFTQTEAPRLRLLFIVIVRKEMISIVRYILYSYGAWLRLLAQTVLHSVCSNTQLW